MNKQIKKLSLVLIITFANLLISISIYAQSPQKMSYQAVIRNSNSDLVVSQAVGMRISILQGSATGTEVYTETQTPTTNANGLVCIEIGIEAGFSSINWAAGPYFIKTETDPTGGTNYTITGTSQLLSVPYSLNAKTAETADYNNLTNLPTLNIANWNTAYGWGNHSTAGYLTTYTETDPIWVAASNDYYTKSNLQTSGLSLLHFDNITNKPTTLSGYGITDAMTTSHVANGITSTNISNWNTAFSWGDHASAGYLTTYTETDPIWVGASNDYYTKSNLQTSGLSLLHFDNITNKPTTLSGYGITDAMTTSHVANGITSTDITNWNNKSNFDGNYSSLTNAPNIANTVDAKTIQLNTSNASSSLNIVNSSSTPVFKVDGTGKMTGDGSGLSNVKSLIAYAGGNSNVIITSYNPYIPTLVTYVEITVPGPGIILAQATGYIQWKSTNDDYCRMSIISDDIATNTAAFGNNYYSYLMLSGDHNLTDSIDEYNNFAYSRVFTVNTAGTYRYNLWSDKGYARCYIQIADANMQVLYFPTGGTGKNTDAIKEEELIVPINPNSLDGK